MTESNQDAVVVAPRSRRTLPLYLLANATSLFGNASIGIVLPWLVLQRTGDPGAAAFVAACAGVPSVLAALVGGWLIDRVGRRRMSVLSDVGSAVAVAALALVDAGSGLTLAWFVLLGVLGALFDVPGMTAREALMANVAEASGRSVEAIAGLRQSVFGVCFLAGPAIAGGLLGIFDAITVVWVTSACSAVAALVTAIMPLAPAPAPETVHPLAGLRVLRGSPALIAIVSVSFGSSLAVAPLLAVLLPAHFVALQAPALLGLTISGFAVGTIAGAIVYSSALSRRPWTSWVLCLVVFTASFALLALMSGRWLPGVAMVLAGVGSGVMGPIVSVVFVRQVPDAVRGSVLGLVGALSLVASPIGLGIVTLALASGSIVGSLSGAAWIVVLAWVPFAVYGLLAPGVRTTIATVTDR